MPFTDIFLGDLSFFIFLVLSPIVVLSTEVVSVGVVLVLVVVFAVVVDLVVFLDFCWLLALLDFFWLLPFFLILLLRVEALLTKGRKRIGLKVVVVSVVV